MEVQRSQAGVVPERARLDSSMLDTMIAERGDKEYKLSEAYMCLLHMDPPVTMNLKKIRRLTSKLANVQNHGHIKNLSRLKLGFSTF